MLNLTDELSSYNSKSYCFPKIPHELGIITRKLYFIRGSHCSSNGKEERWVTDDILNLIAERRKMSTVYVEKYKPLHRIIGRKCTEGKQKLD